MGTGLTRSPWWKWATRRERARGGAIPGGAGRGSGREGVGAVTVVLSGVPTAAGNALGVRQGRGKPGLCGLSLSPPLDFVYRVKLCSKFFSFLIIAFFFSVGLNVGLHLLFILKLVYSGFMLHAKSLQSCPTL